MKTVDDTIDDAHRYLARLTAADPAMSARADQSAMWLRDLFPQIGEAATPAACRSYILGACLMVTRTKAVHAAGQIPAELLDAVERLTLAFIAEMAQLIPKRADR